MKRVSLCIFSVLMICGAKAPVHSPNGDKPIKTVPQILFEEQFSQIQKIDKRSDVEHQLSLGLPLIQTIHGNHHIANIEMTAIALKVSIAKMSEKTFCLAEIPWNDIREKKVKYALCSSYGPNGRSAPEQSADPLNPMRDKTKNLPDLWNNNFENLGLHRAGAIGIKSVSPGLTLVGTSHALISLTSSRLQWKIVMPEGHKLVAFDAQFGKILCVLVSEKGPLYDGELGQPFPTAQIFALRIPGE